MLSRLILNLQSYEVKLTRTVENASELSTFMAHSMQTNGSTGHAMRSGFNSAWLSRIADELSTDIYFPPGEATLSIEPDSLEGQPGCDGEEFCPSAMTQAVSTMDRCFSS